MPQPPAQYSRAPMTFHRRAPAPSASRPPKKAFARRGPDASQTIRRAFQLAFVLLNLWIGARFYLFVRYYETGGQGMFVSRPPGLEGWLPIAALMNLKYLLSTGIVPDVHPAGMFLLVSFLAISIVFRKAFCSWLCPVGTLSEWLWQGGREIFGRNVQAPRGSDIALRSLKYVLLGLFLYAVGSMSAADIEAFLGSPYGLIADVKMLNFFRHLGSTAALVVAALVVLSIFVKNAWCRYLCPYGALMGLVALLSPLRIRRNPDACIDCNKCAKACPSLLPVDRVLSVKSAECTGCLECVAACPAAGALQAGVGRRRAVPAWAMAAGIAVIFLALVALGRMTGRWQTHLPDRAYFELIPSADRYGHPGR